MDTKIKSDIAESATITALLKLKFNVLKPVGDRLAYDLAVDIKGKLLRLQVKSAWFNERKKLYFIDVRRTKTNRRRMLRKRYSENDFDFAIVYIEDKDIFYVFPVDIFNSYSSTLGIIEGCQRQRKLKSADFKERWDLLK